jgi:hypothetical protein
MKILNQIRVERLAVALLAPLMAGVLPAQSMRWNSVQSGYIHDGPGRAVRPVHGIPGSSIMGRAVVSDVDAAWLAPAGNWGLATRQGQTIVLKLQEAEAAELDASGAIESVDRVAWSRDGAIAALYSAASRRLQIARFATQASFGAAIDTAFLEGSISALAVSPSGKVAMAVGGGASRGIYLVEPETTPVFLFAVDAPAFLCFAGSRDTLYAADAAAESLLEFRDLGASPARVPVDLPDPVGIAASGERVFVASGSDRKLYGIQAGTGRISFETSLEQTPVVLERIPNSSLFLLNPVRKPNGSAIVLDTRSDPAVYFIPGGVE